MSISIGKGEHFLELVKILYVTDILYFGYWELDHLLLKEN
jgi:hypothetical protein